MFVGQTWVCIHVGVAAMWDIHLGPTRAPLTLAQCTADSWARVVRTTFSLCCGCETQSVDRGRRRSRNLLKQTPLLAGFGSTSLHTPLAPLVPGINY
jgi:hypothetical protein